MKVGGFRSFFLNSKENRRPLQPAIIKALLPTADEGPKIDDKKKKDEKKKEEPKKGDAAPAAAPAPAAPAATSSAAAPEASSSSGGLNFLGKTVFVNIIFLLLSPGTICGTNSECGSCGVKRSSS